MKIIEKRNCKASKEWKRQWQRWKGKEENDLIITNRASYIHLLVLWFTKDRLTTPRVSVVKEEKKENHLSSSIHHRPRIISNRGRNKTTLYTDTRVYTTITRFVGFLKRVRQRWSSFFLDNRQKKKNAMIKLIKGRRSSFEAFSDFLERERERESEWKEKIRLKPSRKRDRNATSKRNWVRVHRKIVRAFPFRIFRRSSQGYSTISHPLNEASRCKDIYKNEITPNFV